MEDENGVMQDTIKLSNNAEKVSTPGKKQVWRITSRERNKTEGDYITFTNTDVNKLDEVYMFHPTYTYINKIVRDFEAVPLLVDIFDKGKLVYNLPSLSEIQEYARKEFHKLGTNTNACLIHKIIQLTCHKKFGKTKWILSTVSAKKHNKRRS